ncbi:MULTISPECIES: ATP-dependent Clp protease proteolytic subunit [unclassified Streptomyces]|uniref:ATP-dependent Clp protease proteolytic subunit n=1 Tax=unclassified Streptomyces TaxID=2593676 RepID=UPI0036E77B8D
MFRPTARYVLPEFTERTSSGTRTLDPYSRLLAERIVFLGTPVDDTAATDLIAQFMYLEHDAPDRPISLYINSPGGSFEAMCAIYDTMQYLSCEVETYCLGQAGSCASTLLAAGAPGRRHALPGARVVVRQPELTEPMRGQPSDLEIEAQEWARVRELLTVLLARHTGRGAEQISADIERDLILDAAGAKAYGLVDHIMENRKPALPPQSAR